MATIKFQGLPVEEIDCTSISDPAWRKAIAVAQTMAKNKKPVEYEKETFGLYLLRKVREDIRREQRNGISQ